MVNRENNGVLRIKNPGRSTTILASVFFYQDKILAFNSSLYLLSKDLYKDKILMFVHYFSYVIVHLNVKAALQLPVLD